VHNEKHISMRREVNVVEGIELHTGLLTPEEQQHVVDSVEQWVGLGKAGQLLGRTFSAPKKWLPGKGRMTIQFGCCYNYARDAQGRDPGIIPEEVVEPLPPLLRALCRRLTRWGILPAAREPNSAIINIYEAGDCIPPHVDHFDFVRPFCTISLVSTQCIMFAQASGAGEVAGRQLCSLQYATGAARISGCSSVSLCSFVPARLPMQ
jgi:alkylated DNA repair protein alkB family protein 5